MSDEGFWCSSCGQYHKGIPMDIGYDYPPEYLMVPPEERAERVFFNRDICVVDNQVFVIRAILELPVHDGPSSFAWGMGMLLSKEEFERYIELWRTDAEDGAPPLRGHLSGGVRNYTDSDMLEVLGHIRRGLRPSLQVLSETHPLGKDQREGITMEKVHTFLEGSRSASLKRRNASWCLIALFMQHKSPFRALSCGDYAHRPAQCPPTPITHYALPSHKLT